MNNIPERDITGRCEGECRDRVKEGEEERQTKISEAAFHSPDSYPTVPHAKSRNEPPGVFGGHV
jgi:hypothetical protein